jgi:hypothetical protein
MCTERVLKYVVNNEMESRMAIFMRNISIIVTYWLAVLPPIWKSRGSILSKVRSILTKDVRVIPSDSIFNTGMVHILQNRTI